MQNPKFILSLFPVLAVDRSEPRVLFSYLFLLLIVGVLIGGPDTVVSEPGSSARFFPPSLPVAPATLPLGFVSVAEPPSQVARSPRFGRKIPVLLRRRRE
jgi:hypothetical protein